MTIPMWLDPDDQAQEAADRFYWLHGPCCAGCDWWARHNSLVGECRRGAPVSASERSAMIGIDAPIGAGHIMTPREHHCGDFKDEFDWSSLPRSYLALIGCDRKLP